MAIVQNLYSTLSQALIVIIKGNFFPSRAFGIIIILLDK